jgi:hypothetical protein
MRRPRCRGCTPRHPLLQQPKRIHSYSCTSTASSLPHLESHAAGHVHAVPDSTSAALHPVAHAHSSPLSIALAQINAVRTVDAIVHHAVHELLENRHTPSEDGVTTAVVMVDFARMHTTASPDGVLHRYARKAYDPLVNGCVSVFFYVCTLIVRLLALRTISVSHLFHSLFTPPFAERLALHWVPLSHASFCLASLHRKATSAIRARALGNMSRAQTTRMLGVQTETTARIEEERASIRANHVLDVVCGVAILYASIRFGGACERSALARYTAICSSESTAFPLASYLADLLSSTHSALEWFLSSSAPGGLKLNPQLHAMLGVIWRQMISDQTVLLATVAAHARPVLEHVATYYIAHTLVCAFMLGCLVIGASFPLGLLLDLAWMCTIPLRLLHALLSRVHGACISILGSLLLLFRGLKYNRLRHRIDSFPLREHSSHLALGTLWLVVAVLLVPTILAWHVLCMGAFILAGQCTEVILGCIMASVRYAPIVPMVMMIRDSIEDSAGGKRLPGGVWMEVIPPSPSSSASAAIAHDDNVTQQGHVMHLRLHSSSASIGCLFFRAQAFLTRAMSTQDVGVVVKRLMWGTC